MSAISDAIARVKADQEKLEKKVETLDLDSPERLAAEIAVTEVRYSQEFREHIGETRFQKLITDEARHRIARLKAKVEAEAKKPAQAVEAARRRIRGSF